MKIRWNNSLVTLSLLVAVTTLPFLDKPVHIDDPFVLRIAENVTRNPFDPFAGTFNWFGQEDPIFEATTNPPLMSYYLAPFAWISNQSEIAMHAAVILFYAMFASASVMLGNRFCRHPYLMASFVMSSTAVVVSGNLMRDVPAAALATAGIAFFIKGTDDSKPAAAGWGAALCGLSLLTKYSCAVTLPVLLLYPLFQKKWRFCLYAWPMLALLIGWCIQNLIVHGSIHMVYLLMERSVEEGIGWQDKWWGALIILSASLYLFPLLLWKQLTNRQWLEAVIVVCAAGFSVAGVQNYFSGEADSQVIFWTIGGCIFTTFAVMNAAKAAKSFVDQSFAKAASDELFLFAWFMAPFLFSIIFVPFQAVRHLILAIPPLTLISFRILQHGSSSTWKPLAHGLLLFQLFITLGVQYADYEMADVYRKFAREDIERWKNEDQPVWFNGHWGWQYYMNRAGYRYIQKGEWPPQPGDLLVQPQIVPNESFSGRTAYIDQVTYPPSIPIAVMNFQGASFYAIINNWGGNNIPYRFFQDTGLETFKIYEVQSVETPSQP